MHRLIVLCILALGCIPAQASSDRESIPAAIIWKVTNANNVIYLMGELHAYEINSQFRVDYSVVEKIYNTSEKFWTEAPQGTPPAGATQRLSSRVSDQTWAQFQDTLRPQALNIMSRKKSAAEQEAAYKDFIERLDLEDPMGALLSVNFVSGATRLLARTDKPVFVPGFMGAKAAAYERKTGSTKLNFIETPSASEEVWEKTCSNAAEMENLFQLFLVYLQPIQSNELTLSQIRDWYRQLNLDVSGKYVKPLITADSKILNKCNVEPRNRLWYPKIKEAMSASERPQAFLFGIAHLLGDNGLLEMLRKDGYTHIERVVQID
jgi:hypothetical protein